MTDVSTAVDHEIGPEGRLEAVARLLEELADAFEVTFLDLVSAVLAVHGVALAVIGLIIGGPAGLAAGLIGLAEAIVAAFIQMWQQAKPRWDAMANATSILRQLGPVGAAAYRKRLPPNPSVTPLAPSPVPPPDPVARPDEWVPTTRDPNT